MIDKKAFLDALEPDIAEFKHLDTLPGAYEAARKIYPKARKALEAHEGKFANFATILLAYADFCEALIRHGYNEAIMDKREAEYWNGKRREYITLARLYASDPYLMLKQTSLTQDDIMAKWGDMIPEEHRTKFLNGALTIAELAVIKPIILSIHYPWAF